MLVHAVCPNPSWVILHRLQILHFGAIPSAVPGGLLLITAAFAFGIGASFTGLGLDRIVGVASIVGGVYW